jgi:hypothetical protein
MVGRVAVVCPVCGVKLRVLQVRAYVTGLLAFVVPLALMGLSYLVAPVIRGSVDYRIRTVIFVVVLLGVTTLHRRNIPRLLTVRLLEDGEIVRFPLARPTFSESEAEAAPSNALGLSPTKDDRPSWKCLKCGEEIRAISMCVGSVRRRGRMLIQFRQSSPLPR